MRINLVVRKIPKRLTVKSNKKQVKHPTKGRRLSTKARVLTCGAFAPLVACSGTGFYAAGGGYDLEIRASEAGLNAWDTYQNGLITNATLDKEEMHTSPHWTVKAKKEEYKALLQQSKKAKQGRK